MAEWRNGIVVAGAATEASGLHCTTSVQSPAVRPQIPEYTAAAIFLDQLMKNNVEVHVNSYRMAAGDHSRKESAVP
jgi:hypothetical protein